MSRTKEILISLLAIIVLILAITTNVFATSADDLLNALGNNQNNNTVTQIPSKDNNNTNNNTNNNNNKLNNVVNNKVNVSNATEHADAGVDYSIVFIIAVCGVSAIYAYKKIRDYNV
ncbi:MAG: hypothetical protein ACI4VO_05050 [Clostridia bacterium]